MQHTDQNILVESIVIGAGETAKHIKLIVSDTHEVIFHLSLRQARSLAMSLVEQVHRLEVVNSMRNTKQQQTHTANIVGQRTTVRNAPVLRSLTSEYPV